MADLDGAAGPAHGGLVDDELSALGVRADDVLDLSVNVNPYGPCAAVRSALAAARVDRYPDPCATAARRAFADRAGVAAERVAVGNGAVDLMWTLAQVVLSPGDRVLVVEPAFSEMRAAAARARAVVYEHRAEPDRGFAVDFGALDAEVEAIAPRIVYACSPQNPSGVLSPLSDFGTLARRHPKTLFVVDVSFLSLSGGHAEAAAPRDPSVVWLQSLTKDHALPGLRVGAAVAPPALVAALDAWRPPWSVGALAQAAVVAACSEEASRFVAECRGRLLADRRALDAALRDAGLRVYKSDTIYTLASLRPGASSAQLRRRLLTRHGVLVRDATSFGLPGHIRVAARPAPDRERFVAALRRELDA